MLGRVQHSIDIGWVEAFEVKVLHHVTMTNFLHVYKFTDSGVLLYSRLLRFILDTVVTLSKQLLPSICWPGTFGTTLADIYNFSD